MWRKKKFFILCKHCPKMVFFWNFGPLAATEDINQFPKKITFLSWPIRQLFLTIGTWYVKKSFFLIQPSVHTQANRLPSIGVLDSNVQHNRLVHRRIGVHRRIDYHQSAYQIPTFNTTDWYTDESAYTGESITINRRIRFQRSVQQIGTPAKRRTGDRRPATNESPYQIPTFNTTDWYTGEAAYRRPATGDRRVAVSDSNVDVYKTDRRELDQLRSIDGDRPSTPCCQR